MSVLSTFVSLHPYFKGHPGKLEVVKPGFSRFVEKTGTEKKNLFYGFTVNGDEILCPDGSAWSGSRVGKVDKASRSPQSGVVRDRARKKIRSEKGWKNIVI